MSLYFHVQRITLRQTARVFLAGLFVALTLGFLPVASPSPVHAASFVVTNCNDSGAGSLRQAILDANASPGTDDITFNLSCTQITPAITYFGEGLAYEINGDVNIIGPGMSSLALDGSNPAVHVMFHIYYGSKVTISGLTIQNVRSDTQGLLGLGIWQQGTNSLTVTDVAFVNLHNNADDGGAIWHTGPLTVTGSLFTGNVSQYAGGAIFSYGGPLTVTNSTFSDNIAYAGGPMGSAGEGGAICIYSGAVTITNSSFVNNHADIFGGAIFAIGGVLTVTNSTFSNNDAPMSGAAIAIADVETTLTANTFSGGFGYYDITNTGLLYAAGNIFDGYAYSGGTYDNGYNVTSQGGLTNPTSVNGATLNLGAISGGGPGQQVQIPGSGSDAIGVIPYGTQINNNGVMLACDTTALDQPGQTRPQVTGGPCTAGAVEVAGYPRLNIDSVTHAEGAPGTTTYTFTVSLSVPSLPAGTTFDIATRDGTATAADGDYVPRSLTGQSIPPGAATYTFDVTVNGDLVQETDEAFYVDVTNVSNAMVVNGTGTGIILNDDTAGIHLDGTASGATEGGATGSYALVLDSPPAQAVTVTAASDGQCTVNPPTLTFTNGNWNTPQVVTVTAVDDLVDEASPHDCAITNTTASADTYYDGLTVLLTLPIIDNDTAGVILDPTAVEVSESGTSATFTVALTSQPVDVVGVSFIASNGSDWYIDTITSFIIFTPADWSTPQTMTVTGYRDYRVEGDRTENIPFTSFSYARNPADANYEGLIAILHLTIRDVDTAGVVITPTSGLTTTEAGGTAIFAVSLAAYPTGDVAINLSSSNTAEGTVSPVSLTFNSGNWSAPQTVTVTGVDDFVVDGGVPFTIITAPAVTTDIHYSGLDPADVSVTNQDNDVVGVTVTPTSSLTTTEAGGAATFTVALNTQPGADVTIGLSSSNPAEGTVSPASLVFNSGDWNTPQTVTVTGVDDPVIDGNIGYTILTAPAASGDGDYNNFDPADVSVTNEDNDVAGVTVSAISGNTTEAGGTATFTVVLNTQPGTDVMIGLNSSNTAEGTVSPASLTFTSGNWNAPQTVTVTGVDDSVIDGNVTFAILTAPAVSGDSHYDSLDAADVSVTNNDNDVAGITVTPISGNTTEAGGTATFTVVLNTQPGADVTIALSSSDTSEGTVSPALLTFTPVTWSTLQTVTVTGVNDSVMDGNIGYTIVTAPAASGDGSYSGFDAVDVSVTNNDNDVTGVTVSAISGNTTEAGGTATFTLVLSSQPSADVTLGLSSSDTTEGTVSPASLTFTSGDWNAPQTVTVTGVDDPFDDDDVAYTILIAPAASADGAYNGLDAADVSVTNTDNDTAGITVSPISGNTTEASGTATFTIVLNVQPAADVTIALSSSDTTEGMVSPASLTFTSTDWNLAQTVTVTGVDDAAVDGNVGYSIVTAPAVSADGAYNDMDSSDVAVTNLDNDTAGITVTPTSGLTTTEAGGTATFTIVLNTQPGDNVVIGLSSSDMTEGTVSPASVTFTPANWNVPQTVTVTGVDDTDADGPQPYTIQTTAASSGDGNYNGLDAADVAVTNTDNDVPGVTVSPTSLNLREGGPAGTYTIRLNTTPTAGSVTLDVSFNPAQLTVNGSSVSPVTLTFTDTTPQTVAVAAVDNKKVDGARTGTIGHAIISSGASEYPAGMAVSSVRVRITDDESKGTSDAGSYPPPPPAPRCGDLNFDPSVSVRAGIPDAYRYGVFCRVIVQDGQYLTWYGSPLTNSGQIGVQSILVQNVMQAVDVFSPVGINWFEGGSVVCLRGTGNLIFLAASQAPRVPQALTTYTVKEFGGFTCGTLYEPGTLVLVNAPAPSH